MLRPGKPFDHFDLYSSRRSLLIAWLFLYFNSGFRPLRPPLVLSCPGYDFFFNWQEAHQMRKQIVLTGNSGRHCLFSHKAADDFVLVKGGTFMNTKSNYYGKSVTIQDFYNRKIWR